LGPIVLGAAFTVLGAVVGLVFVVGAAALPVLGFVAMVMIGTTIIRALFGMD
jgi:hypothetical protein